MKGHLQALQLYVYIAVGFVHCPLAWVLLPTVCVSSHLLLELELSSLIGINVDPVVGNPLCPFGDQAASMQGIFIQVSNPACGKIKAMKHCTENPSLYFSTTPPSVINIWSVNWNSDGSEPHLGHAWHPTAMG